MLMKSLKRPRDEVDSDDDTVHQLQIDETSPASAKFVPKMTLKEYKELLASKEIMGSLSKK